MWIPKDLGWMAQRLKEGHRVNRITVRDLLRMFKAERRGLNKIQDIRTALDYLGLQTEPDFESAWIDGRIRVQLKNGSSGTDRESQVAVLSSNTQPLEIAEAEQGSDEPEEMEFVHQGSGTVSLPPIVITGEGIVETKLSEPPDPTFRIGSLPAANKSLITVGQDDPLTRAVTKMWQFDYSQLPIMHGEREVKGMISWKSIASRYAIGGECCKVQHCREDAQVVDANGTLFDAIPTIVKYGYVLVRSQEDRKITGIVTASDLSLQFQQLAEPFLLLREIELHIRQLLHGKVMPEDFQSLMTGDLPGVTPQSISDLSFGEYVRLLQRPGVWTRLALNIDQNSLTSQLEQVRVIRNDVMHFDPDPMTQDQMDALKNTAAFMQRLYELLP